MANFERDYYEQSVLWEQDLLSIPAERERITSTIELIPPNVQTILDIGCGSGAFLNSLPDVYETVGLDFSQEALKYVKTKAILGDISALPFASESFDLVTCLEVLEHLPFGIFEKALSELQRVSNKYIIISVPNCEDLDYHLVICPACRCWYNPYRHVRSFDPEKLGGLFEQFELYLFKEIGPLTPRPQYNRFLFAAYRLWRNAPPPHIAVCPQCGYKPTGSQSSVPAAKSGGLLVYNLKFLKPLTKLVWRPKKNRRWLIALYVRKYLKEK